MAKHARSSSQDDMLKHPSTKRAKEIDADTPLDQLDGVLNEQKTDHPVRNVMHWFRSKDIRQEDNKALHRASEKAREGKGVLLTGYLYSPRDMEWHGTSPARSDFLMQSLSILRDQLHKKHIPLSIIKVEERGEKTEDLIQFIRDNDISHVFANYEYEVDELRRDIKVAKHVSAEDNVSFELCHDQTVVEPRTIKTGSGTPAKVFTPYHRSWLAKLSEEPESLDLVSPPEGNDKEAVEKFKALFDGELPELPENKRFKDDEERDRIRQMWPAGHDAGMKRLEDFLSKKVQVFALPRMI